MKKIIIGAAALAGAVAALCRFGPALHERALKKCQQMMRKCGEMFAQQTGPAMGTERAGAAAPGGTEQAATGEHKPAEAVGAR